MRRTHRLLGLAMLLPLLAWVATGVVFHLKPGWGPAYASPRLPQSPIDPASLPAAPRFATSPLSLTWIRTPLGLHLLARTEAGPLQVDPADGRPLPPPPPERLLPIFEAIRAADPARFGDRMGSITLEGSTYRCDSPTGVVLRLDWNDLSLSQRGPDTDRIDALYRIHYLQWTGNPAFDRPFALVGLGLLLALAISGLRLIFTRS